MKEERAMKKKTWLVRTLSLCLALFMAIGMVWTGRDLGVRAETQYNEVEAHFGVLDGSTVIYLTTTIVSGPDAGKSLHAMSDGSSFRQVLQSNEIIWYDL